MQSSSSETVSNTESSTVNCDSVNTSKIVNDDYVQPIESNVPSLKSKVIKFAHLNIRSLVSKIDELSHICAYTFDIIGVNETLCDHTISDSEVKLDGSNILRRDRTRDGGGVAILIKESFECVVRGIFWLCIWVGGCVEVTRGLGGVCQCNVK